MRDVYLCDGVRTPFGRYGGSLSRVRADDLAAIPIRALRERHPGMDWGALDDVWMGCANQAGEDNRNVARMALLLAGLPHAVPGVTVNRLCGSGLDAIATAARAIRTGEIDVAIAGGVESMSRAPFVLGKAEMPFARDTSLQDTTMGWRFVNQALRAQYGVETMPETAENLVRELAIAREDQDRFALASQSKAIAAQKQGFFANEIVPVTIQSRKGLSSVELDEHPRETSLDALAKLKPITGPDGTVTAGNASGINDGAAATLLASDVAVRRYGLKAKARILGSATAGVLPRVMGIGPVPAIEKLLSRIGVGLKDFDAIELNEAFAAQALAVLRTIRLSDDDPRVNPNGGAIALGHPLGASGARLAMTAANQLVATKGRYGLCAMCIGVGQGIALAIERV
ncbi:MAG TPA: 3-oxoadipyl-CoA thiolase [Vicinamibacterales bacterium]|nr:3-oxoadipyl-CoA thiolase [Vicinamibacterales bacterium]